MKVTLADKSIAWLALFSGLSISAVAVYYSVAGLISIFAAAAVPIAVMGVTLELSKLVATVWLKQNWFIAPKLIRAYLLVAVAILMLITSMGIFGYLSKAHLDQAVPTGDVAAQVALLDEKIKTERDNIDASKKALQQMDAQVDSMLGRTDTDKGAERAVQIRKNQTKERASLQADIANSQKAIAALNVERAPIASELRKVEAEVGPIKYIAALLYGDNPDQNVLEKAVRWVIILIVIIFDPLAVVMLLASQYSFQYFRKQKETNNITDTDTFFDVLRSDVKQEALEDEQADIDEANAAIAEIPPEEPIVNTHEFSVVENISPADESNVREWTEEEVAALDDRIEEVRKELATDPDLTVEVDVDADVDEQDDSDAKRAWKAANPNDTIKRQRVLYEKGLIENLPWETVEKFDQETESTSTKDVVYVQNSEQSDDSIWKRIKDAKAK